MKIANFSRMVRSKILSKVQRGSNLPFILGAVLGVFGSYRYSHTDNLPRESLISSLKGQDMLMYLVFKELGLQYHIGPALRQKMQNVRYTYGGYQLQELIQGSHKAISEQHLELLVAFQEAGSFDFPCTTQEDAVPFFKLTYETEDIEGPNNPSREKIHKTFAERRESLIKRNIQGLDQTAELAAWTCVGKEFLETAVFDGICEEEHEYFGVSHSENMIHLFAGSFTNSNIRCCT